MTRSLRSSGKSAHQGKPHIREISVTQLSAARGLSYFGARSCRDWLWGPVERVRYGHDLCSVKPRMATKEGQWVLRTTLHIRTRVFLCSDGSKNPALVLIPLSPYAIASLGVA